MTARILSRYLYGPALQIARTTAFKSSYLGVSLKNIPYTDAKPQLWAKIMAPRFFSQKTEEMIVDYDHVKKATSNDKIYIFDVREPEEIKEHGKIPNSVNIPLGNVSTVLGVMGDGDFKKTYKKSKPSEDDEIIFYCMIGKRSGMAQQNALNLGYKNVKNYVGSWTDWASKIQ